MGEQIFSEIGSGVLNEENVKPRKVCQVLSGPVGILTFLAKLSFAREKIN